MFVEIDTEGGGIKENDTITECIMRDEVKVNWLNKAALILGKSRPFSRWCNTVGITILFLMVCLTFIDVVLRYIFSQPIKGTYELTGLMLVLVVFLGIAYAQDEKLHVAVDVITDRLSPTARLVVETITTILSIGIFGILIWRSFAHVLYLLKVGAIHAPLVPVPSAPFAAIIVLGCTLLCLLLLRGLFNNMAEALRLHLRGYLWLLMFGIPILVVILAILWMQPTLWQLSLPVVGIIGIAFSLLLFFAGIPISFALMMTGFLFLAHVSGPGAALDVVGVELYRVTTTYVWAVIAFFVLMGFFALFAGFGEDLYYTAYKWLGRMPGGLAMATVGACTGFAAIVGDPMSVTATMGVTSLPEMRRYKYDDRLSSGVIAAGATIGPMIPPSVSFIIYAILTQQSIGKLFIAGIVPGLLLAIAFMALIYLRCRLNPSLGPPGGGSSWRERLVSLKAAGPVVILFLLVIGGIYAGIFTPCEGGAIGAVGAVIIGLIMRRFTWQKFNNALLGAGKVIAMTFLILVGAVLFTRFVGFCNLSGVITQFVTGLTVPSFAIVLLILLVFLVLGFVIDTLPLILIGIPIVHPVVVALGYDPIWFTVLMVLTIHLGMITPPVGLNIFTLKGVAKDIPIGTIYRGVFPFVLATLVVVGLILILPPLATWLPNLLY